MQVILGNKKIKVIDSCSLAKQSENDKTTPKVVKVKISYIKSCLLCYFILSWTVFLKKFDLILANYGEWCDSMTC